MTKELISAFIIGNADETLTVDLLILVMDMAFLATSLRHVSASVTFLEAWLMPVTHDELQRLKARCGRSNDGNENKWFLTGVKNTVDFSAMGYQHISLGNGNRFPARTKAVLTATRKDGPCILAIRMHMSRDLLAGLDIPSNDRCVSRLGDD